MLTHGMELLHVDCETCSVRGIACGECMMSVLIQPVDDPAFDEADVVALATLVDGGLLPPLRLVEGGRRADSGAGRRGSTHRPFADAERVV